MVGLWRVVTQLSRSGQWGNTFTGVKAERNIYSKKSLCLSRMLKDKQKWTRYVSEWEVLQQTEQRMTPCLSRLAEREKAFFKPSQGILPSEGLSGIVAFPFLNAPLLPFLPRNVTVKSLSSNLTVSTLEWERVQKYCTSKRYRGK